MNILRALDDPKVFGSFFVGDTWKAWRVFLAALFGLPIRSKQQIELYRRCTGRTTRPKKPFKEAWLIAGRRAGKSFLLAVVAVFLATFRDWRPFLGPGEIGTIAVVAADRKQARTILRYIIGLLETIPMLSTLIVGKTAESVMLKRRIVIEVHTASFRSTRGYTIVCALLDEMAFWASDETASDPDIEVLNAIKPGMATIPNAMLLIASSPYSRKGALWEAHRRHYGKDDDPILVWHAPTRTMNPRVPQSYIDEQIRDDPARAAAEYLAQFRTDIESFVAREAVDACVIPGLRELPPDISNTSYVAFLDPSGGAIDSFAACVAHNDAVRQTVVIDALYEVPAPFSPEDASKRIAEFLQRYGLFSAVGDRYGGEWPKEQLGKHGVFYELSTMVKSDIYVNALPLINSGRIELLDHPKLVNQICNLERRTARGGRSSIDHPPRQHDDLANVACGAAVLLNLQYGGFDTTGRWLDGPTAAEEEAEAQAEARRAYFASPYWRHNRTDRFQDADKAREEQEASNAEFRRRRTAAYVMSGGLLRNFPF